VALHAFDLGVLAEQRELGPGMIKSTIQPGRRNLAPTCRAVTGLAGLRKPATVGISMAIGAVAEGYSGVTRLFIRTGSVALLASDLGMQAREGIACKGMIKFADADRLPITGGVTLQAIGPEPTLVLVLMTCDATR